MANLPNSDLSTTSLELTTQAWKNQIFCEDALIGLSKIPDASIDLLIADPPYGLGKDYGNESDKLAAKEYLEWMQAWIRVVLPKLKANASVYIFLTWRYSPEVFVMLKEHLTQKNEIIWDRRVPSMGGSVRNYSSVHDTVGFFVNSKDYYFDLDAIRIPYDEATKKARSRKKFEGAKWLEMGFNPKDIWSVSRLHREHAEREDHPTQKPLEIIERMIKASCPEGGVVLDPFMGSGTTAVAAQKLGRHFVGFELNAEYCELIQRRLFLQIQEAQDAEKKKLELDVKKSASDLNKLKVKSKAKTKAVPKTKPSSSLKIPTKPAKAATAAKTAKTAKTETIVAKTKAKPKALAASKSQTKLKKELEEAIEVNGPIS